MIYYVLVRKGWGVKKIQCRNLEKAREIARLSSFFLDIKIREKLPKKEWVNWTYKDCYFEYDLTSAKYKDDAFTFVRIQSQHLPKCLYGKSITQIEAKLQIQP